MSEIDQIINIKITTTCCAHMHNWVSINWPVFQCSLWVRLNIQLVSIKSFGISQSDIFLQV